MRKWMCILAGTLWLSLAFAGPTPGLREPYRLVRQLAAPAARQGVAVDAEHLYAIDARRIEKYARASGARVAVWEAGDASDVVHLNSGVVIEGLLHCAHSNYPALPMRSSIEVFDVASLRHLRSIPLPEAPGSATWVDRRDGRWWVAFAHYAGGGGEPGRGPGDSRLVAYDAQWREQARYVYPPALVQRFGRFSNSGGAWGPDGHLHATGHDAREVYELDLPARGDTLEWRATRPAPIAGQGIAWDPQAPGLLWGVERASRRLVAMRAR